MSKSSKLICRITTDMKKALLQEADERNEAESVIVREALREYFARRAVAAYQSSARAAALTTPAPPATPINYLLNEVKPAPRTHKPKRA